MKIVFIGSGAIATAIGDVLAAKNCYDVVLISIEDSVVESVNSRHFNYDYFPYCRLSDSLRASVEIEELRDADVVFLAIPSTAVVDYVVKNQEYINQNALIVNLAKGFGNDGKLIPECLMEFLPNQLLSLKGPSFAREVIKRQETGLTAGSNSVESYNIVKALFDDTCICTDFTDDVKGVEYSSILKNIYAIIVGIVDANFESANLRSLVISKAINEMLSLITTFGGKQQTMFNYCGFGDFTLTALHDMSRNRTLGLQIGKNFFIQDLLGKVVLEGPIAVNVFYNKMKDNDINIKSYPLMNELYHVINDRTYPIKKFVKNILA